MRIAFNGRVVGLKQAFRKAHMDSPALEDRRAAYNNLRSALLEQDVIRLLKHPRLEGKNIVITNLKCEASEDLLDLTKTKAQDGHPRWYAELLEHFVISRKREISIDLERLDGTSRHISTNTIGYFKDPLKAQRVAFDVKVALNQEVRRRSRQYLG